MQENDRVILEQLVARIEQAGLQKPAQLLLDIFAPIDVVSAQLALFVSPFTTGSRLKSYATVLSQEHSWKELRRILARQDC